VDKDIKVLKKLLGKKRKEAPSLISAGISASANRRRLLTTLFAQEAG
jgi:hypothetical protein